jgi:hypothetical protein
VKITRFYGALTRLRACTSVFPLPRRWWRWIDSRAGIRHKSCIREWRQRRFVRDVLFGGHDDHSSGHSSSNSRLRGLPLSTLCLGYCNSASGGGPGGPGLGGGASSGGSGGNAGSSGSLISSTYSGSNGGLLAGGDGGQSCPLPFAKHARIFGGSCLTLCVIGEWGTAIFRSHGLLEHWQCWQRKWPHWGHMLRLTERCVGQQSISCMI